MLYKKKMLRFGIIYTDIIEEFKATDKSLFRMYESWFGRSSVQQVKKK